MKEQYAGHTEPERVKFMKYLYQAGIILLFTFLGEVLAKIIPFPIPAAIWGLLLLFLTLILKIIRADRIRETSGFLAALLPVLFVAPTVNLMDQAKALLGSLPVVTVIIIVSTFLTFLVSGRVTQSLRSRRKEGGDHD